MFSALSRPVMRECRSVPTSYRHKDVVILAELVIDDALRSGRDIRMGVGLPPDQLEADSLVGHKRAHRAVQLLHDRPELLTLVGEITR